MGVDSIKDKHAVAAKPRNIDTAIIATLGPATASEDKIRALYLAGVNCFRLNFSHGTHADHKKNVRAIRKVEKELGVQIGILADMQGPKLRIGSFADDATITLHKGMRIRFDLDPAPGDETRVNFPHPKVLKALKKDGRFLMDDGNIAMKITAKGKDAHGDFIEAEVVTGKELSGKKGVNVPDLSMPVSTLTKKDRKDLPFALGLGVDWIAQSFVQTADDVKEAKALIKGRAQLIAKIEKPDAVKNFAEILDEADAVMIARGDLGVEIPLEQVPAVQKVLTYQARLAGKPAIIATQMLESMINNPRPTRAEASDVAQAVFDGASGVMLSGETAVGAFPVKAVRVMHKICREMENGKILSLAMRAQMKAISNDDGVAAPFEPRHTKKADNDNSKPKSRARRKPDLNL